MIMHGKLISVGRRHCDPWSINMVLPSNLLGWNMENHMAH